MANSKLTKPLFCAAIDFGTTYTGLAFSEWEKKKYVTATWDHDGPKGIELKAPTAVLFDQGKNFVAFGFDAVKKYSKMNDKQKNDCYYFERFKMELHKQERFTENLVLKSTNNPEERSMKALKVISFAMKFLKNKLLKIFEDSKFNIHNTEIRWVITVPAIWRASARQLMRKAAYEAGLCDKSEPHNIILSLEPESAALFVHDYLELKEKGVTDETIEESMETLELSSTKHQLIKYSKYLILDCGGGTIDVCVHQVLNSQDGFTVKECYRATGGAWGGIYVDQKFSEFLDKIFSAEFMNKAKSKLLTAWTEMNRDFEFWKRQVQPKTDIENIGNEDDDDDDDFDDDDSVHIGLPFNFVIECQKHHNDKMIEDIVKQSGVKDVKYQMGKLTIKGKIMRKFLMSQINQIIDHIHSLQKTDECFGFKAVFLVGGFSECQVLQDAIKKTFSKMCDVVVPINPSLAIVKGSIKFGFNPTVISQRVSQYTYGLSVTRKFQMDDKEEYKYINSEGKIYCKNIFKEIIRELSPITSQNCLHKSIYIPVDVEQKSISIFLLKSSSADVKYITDKGVEKLGNLHVPLPGAGLDRKVEVTVDFSGTEIFASVKNLNTHETNFLSVDFLCLEC